jgi:hypothetical protein
MSTLGFADAVRDTVSPYAVTFGTVTPGQLREIGPASSGQTLAGGAAVTVDVTSDTDYRLTTQSTNWAAGGNTISASALGWKHHGVSEPYTAYSTSAGNVDVGQTPATRTHSYDFAATVPTLQAAGAYTATVTWTVTPEP